MSYVKFVISSCIFTIEIIAGRMLVHHKRM